MANTAIKTLWGGAPAGVVALMLAVLAQPAVAQLEPSSDVNITVKEGETATFTFEDEVPTSYVIQEGRLQGTTVTYKNEAIRYFYRTEDGTAKAGKDYEASNGHILFTPDQLVAEVSVKTLNNGIYDYEDKHFNVVFVGAHMYNPTAKKWRGYIDGSWKELKLRVTVKEGNSASSMGWWYH
ncbi:MAG: hypothetical protein OXF58_04805 [Gammaproteobacteria bacterium]|nr:hypothetical protein [Gammaproteobacteria bacterium]